MMVALAPEQTIQSLEIVKVEEIAAPPEIVFESILATIGPESELPDGTPFPMTIEPWPGGRWFRDLGNNAGHLWAHVQVIKPPTILELSGPLFMSYAAISHVQYRVKAEGTGAEARTRLTMKHTAFGLIVPDHAKGVHEGWEAELRAIRKRAEAKASR